MRKLIMWNLVSLDGYFEGEKNWTYLGTNGCGVRSSSDSLSISCSRPTSLCSAA